MKEKKQKYKELITTLPQVVSGPEIEKKWQVAVENIEEKIIVLDDDPTGIQTVHSLPVYTSWERETLRKIIRSREKVVYILTNSRALTTEETEKLHRKLIRDLEEVAKEEGEDYLLISRSDSTLRGHYPLETDVLYKEMVKRDNQISGEIIIPFFKEGGRITYRDVHYVQEGDTLIPAGETEFADDSTFGYKSSNLKEWIEEKTEGQTPAEDVMSISLTMLRNEEINRITNILRKTNSFDKIIVNAMEYNDLKVLLLALAEVLKEGKKFLFRTAASFVRIIGGIKPRPLLKKEDLCDNVDRVKPGLIIIGSHTKKTTSQLNKLQELDNISFIEWEVRKALSKKTLEAESNRVTEEVEKAFAVGKDACVYTTREYFKFDREKDRSEKNLKFSTRISNGLVKVVKNLKAKPGFLIAKGGITSSDIGVDGLGVDRAQVLGQILPGVPVWRLCQDCRFPGLPYVIFPGNVGKVYSLKKAMQIFRN